MHQRSRRLHFWALLVSAFLLFACAHPATADFTVVVDYTYDTLGFFTDPSRQVAMQAAADRWSNIISSTLLAVSPSGTGSGTPAGWRIGFTHPGTGASFQVSTAAGTGSDPLIGAGAANVYGFAGLTANNWILYAGGRALGGPAGVGGTGTGTNFTTTFDDLSGPMHRGLISNTPTNTVNDIPVWGGSISFDTATAWHFDPTTAAPLASVDFYSIALHEIAHALGLSVGFNQWTNFQTGATFTGPNAVGAFNADNGTTVTALNLVSSTNRHWEDNTMDSRIFQFGNPNYVGTVGAGNLQDLLEEPVANFTLTVRRFEATNVDVGGLQDLGFQVVPEPGSFILAGISAAGMAYCAWRRKRAKAKQEVEGSKAG